MNQLSVAIITFNEEKNIARCIDSVTAFADEIVVVDSFSTDKTKEICLSKKLRFVEHTFEGHIQQKNFAISQCTHQYILSLDADEAVSPEMARFIENEKQNFQYDGYVFNRLTNYCGKWIRHTGWYPDKKLRLWDKKKGKWGGINPHDMFIMQEGARIRLVKVDILHYSYYSIWDHVAQINNFTEILSRESIAAGKKTNLAKILFKPVWKFYRDYIFKAGFLDGYYGFVISALSAWATFVKQLKMKEIQKSK